MNVLAFFVFLGLTTLADAADFKPVLGPIDLPRPHAAHREYGTEWWYFTGHLESSAGRTFGFELTFFRVGLREKRLSNWEAQSLIVSHFALTDDQNGRFFFSDERERESFEQAGASDEGLNVWLKNWRASLVGNEIRLEAEDTEKSLKLAFSSEKPLVLHGDRGFSKKGPLPGEASIYSSLTRLKGGGQLSLGTENFKITQATAWMDHEFFTTDDQKGAKGWDWFALQLSNGEELMLYQLRDAAGNVTEFSSGTLIKADGSSAPITQIKIETLGRWKSPKTAIVYPNQWKISLPGYELEVIPTIPNQEITGGNTTGVSYWEGRSIVSGTHSGQAYVELVGY